MKLVIQRVEKAKVRTRKKTTGVIDKGLFVLVGFAEGDTNEMVSKMADKLLNLRIMADKKGKMNLSPIQASCKLLVVSQFTLNADTSAGRRPSFILSAKPKEAKVLYDYFIDTLRQKIKVETGEFGEYMSIHTILDGPVTIIIER